MFLVIGHSTVAVNLARWCSQRRPTRLIGLASNLEISDEIGDCEILPLPQPMTPSQLPDGGQKPTAVILVDSEILEGEDALSAMRQRWPETPILSEKSLVDEMIDSVDKIDVEDIITAAYKEKVRAWERHAGATVLESYIRHLNPRSQSSVMTILILMHSPQH